MMLRAFIVLLWVLMSQQAMDAFGKIAEAEIISGVMNLEGGLTGMVYALGKRGGVTWKIEARWKNGFPEYINFREAEYEL